MEKVEPTNSSQLAKFGIKPLEKSGGFNLRAVQQQAPTKVVLKDTLIRTSKKDLYQYCRCCGIPTVHERIVYEYMRGFLRRCCRCINCKQVTKLGDL